jgi:uncharacterized DUF497 family protein
MPTVTFGAEFEWDRAKAIANEKKHGVSFIEATTVFADPSVLVIDDGSGSGRLLAIGHSHRGRLLCVAHEQRDPRDRLISARVATRQQSDLYANPLR